MWRIAILAQIIGGYTVDEEIALGRHSTSPRAQQVADSRNEILRERDSPIWTTKAWR